MFLDFTTITKFKDAYPKIKKGNILEESPLFAFIHADWCGHCTKVIPEWQKFIKKLKSKTKFIKKKVVAIDIKDDVLNHILKNHPGDFLARVLQKSVLGYPTLFFMSQKHEKGLHESTIFSYSGERTAEGFIEFINEFNEQQEQKEKDPPAKKNETKKGETKNTKNTKNTKTKEKKTIKETQGGKKKTSQKTNEKK